MDLQDLMFVLPCFGLVSFKSSPVIYLTCWKCLLYAIVFQKDVFAIYFLITEFRLCAWCDVCVCMCVFVYVRVYLIFLKQGSLLNPELAVSGRLDGQ